MFRLADVYDALVDWPKRLARETPFYRHVFEEVGAGSAVDVACGSGRHAAMFRDWGLRVEAADVSPEMVALARQRFGESPNLRWVVRGFAEPIVSGPFDAAVCVGNSLALAPDAETAAEVLRQMLDSVRPGGAAVVHVLNLRALPEGPCRWQVIKRATVDGRELLLVKGVHRCGRGGFVDLVVVPVVGEGAPHTESVPLLEIDPDWLRQAAGNAGAASVSLYGDYHRAPFDISRSPDMIMLARK
ncbi:MAG: class I SAM-dependent methyltransferase [Patescibacteria group bacterium]|nr:class I SAM-dependent methyltransferase [Patescibacteria group bacterium]